MNALNNVQKICSMKQTIHVQKVAVLDLIIDKLVFNNALNNNHTIKKIIARKLVQVIMLIQNKAMSVIISVFIIY